MANRPSPRCGILCLVRAKIVFNKNMIGWKKLNHAIRMGVTALPGAKALLDRLDELNIPWAIVTSGSIPVAYARRACMDQLPKTDVFITAGVRLLRRKPEPDAISLWGSTRTFGSGGDVIAWSLKSRRGRDTFWVIGWLSGDCG
ncbi:hypothetical protein [Hafnia alvei]|uniref:hypothetical protein n=1 Tax=Hafnia alvei TaxID=569 RepID=UPI0034DD2F15